MDIITTGCKINLYLSIGEQREDGYHSLDTLFFPLSSPCDQLLIAKKESVQPSIEVACQTQGIDKTNNTLTKAFHLFMEKCHLPIHLLVELKKNVPHGAGLGGGSANAAGLLLYLQKIATDLQMTPLSQEELCSIAKDVGADVPFFLVNQAAVGSGIGEKLQICENPPYLGHTLLLVCPDLMIPTPWAFHALDDFRKKNKKVATSFLTRQNSRAISFFTDGFCPQNDFEEVVFKKYPKLESIKNQLLQNGASIALLCGTGSSLFGIFTKESDAKKAQREIKEITYRQKLRYHAGA